MRPVGRLGEQLQRPVRLAGRQQAAGGDGEGAEDLLGPARLPCRRHQPVGEGPGRTGLAAVDQDADLGPAQQEQLGHVAFGLGPVGHRLGVGQRPVPLPTSISRSRLPAAMAAASSPIPRRRANLIPSR
jgi:hypothetical protein